MDTFDDEPVSLPCSNEEAKIGLPSIVQLHLVNAALEKTPLPREDFYRQYSVTPERQTPEGERTPPPPPYSPGKHLAQEKAFAGGVANAVRKFHAGRVKLRKEEAEQEDAPEESPDYWISQTHKWQGYLWRLMVEMEVRKARELKGEAEKGYTQAMLLSPLQSPSPPPSNGSLPQDLHHLKTTNTASDVLQEITSQPYAVSMQKPLQPTPEHSPDHLPTLTRGQKRTRTETEDQEEKALEPTSRKKRKRMEVPPAQQEQEPPPAMKSTQSAGNFMSKHDRVEAKGKPKRKNLVAPLAQLKLPWKLRSRKAESYCETVAGISTGNRDRRKPKARVKSCLAERIT